MLSGLTLHLNRTRGLQVLTARVQQQAAGAVAAGALGAQGGAALVLAWLTGHMGADQRAAAWLGHALTHTLEDARHPPPPPQQGPVWVMLVRSCRGLAVDGAPPAPSQGCCAAGAAVAWPGRQRGGAPRHWSGCPRRPCPATGAGYHHWSVWPGQPCPAVASVTSGVSLAARRQAKCLLGCRCGEADRRRGPPGVERSSGTFTSY